jgi:hypothetical protein
MTWTKPDSPKPVATLRAKVLTAFAAGLPVEAIAAELRLRPEAVAEIIDQDRRPRERVIERPPLMRQNAKFARCPTCGGMVEQPCRLCAARRRETAHQDRDGCEIRRNHDS